MEKIWELILILALAGTVLIVRPKDFKFRNFKTWKRETHKGARKKFSIDRKQCIRDLVVLAVIFAVSFFMESVVFQWNSFGSKAYEQTVTLEEADNIKTQFGRKVYEYSLDGSYLGSIYLNYESEKEIKTVIDLTYQNSYQQEENGSTRN